MEAENIGQAGGVEVGPVASCLVMWVPEKEWNVNKNPVLPETSQQIPFFYVNNDRQLFFPSGEFVILCHSKYCVSVSLKAQGLIHRER